MTEGFTKRIAEAYGGYSEKYVSILEPILKPMVEALVKLGKAKRGELVLDLSTGTGLIARDVASTGAMVFGLDISSGVLGIARQLSRGEIPFVEGDAHRLPFASNSFDLLTCGFSLSHFSDGSAALAEIRRVLCARGHFITSAWGNKGENPSKKAAVEVRRRLLEARETTFEGEFAEDVWASPQQGCKTLEHAGFVGVQVTTSIFSGQYADTSEAVEAALAWPITRYRIARLNPQDRHKLREDTIAAIRDVDDLRWKLEVHYYQAVSPGSD